MIHAAEVQEREAAHNDGPTTGTYCTFVQSAPSISQKTITADSQVSRAAMGTVLPGVVQCTTCPTTLGGSAK